MAPFVDPGMRVGLSLVVVSVILSGCSGLPGNETPDETSLPEFPLSVTMGNVTAGVFNVTLNSTLDANATLNATWVLEIFPVTSQNVTGGNQTNATANATAPATSAQPTVSQSGQGIPATANVTLEPGNYTLRATATMAGYDAGLFETNLSVAAISANATVEPGPEPMEGASEPDYIVPDPIQFSGSMTGAPLIVLNGCVSDDETHTFELDGPVRSGTFTLAFPDGIGNDLDWEISGPGASHASAAGGPEAPKTFADMQPGTWSVTVVCFSVDVEVDYTVDIAFA